VLVKKARKEKRANTPLLKPKGYGEKRSQVKKKKPFVGVTANVVLAWEKRRRGVRRWSGEGGSKGMTAIWWGVRRKVWVPQGAGAQDRKKSPNYH